MLVDNIVNIYCIDNCKYILNIQNVNKLCTNLVGLVIDNNYKSLKL